MGLAGSVDRRLCRLFDWLSGLPAEEAAAFRAEIFGTMMLQPATLLLASLGIAMTSATAAILTGRGWATAWFVSDLILLVLRMIPTVRAQRRGGAVSLPTARMIVSAAFVVFVLFGLGCAAAFHTGQEQLRVVVTAATMGLVAGIATRWAALPRLAAAAIALCCLPFCFVIALQSMAAAVLFAVVAGGTALLTLQNQRTLMAMLRARYAASRLAATDALTLLPNRAGLLAHLDTTERAARSDGGQPLAILFVDLDGFKAINDTHGHAAGDQALMEVAARLRAVAAPHFACRLGGDEFVVAATGLTGPAADALALAIRERLQQPIRGIVPNPLRLGASMGIASGTLPEATGEQLLHRADMVLYANRYAERQRRDGATLPNRAPASAGSC